MLTPHENGILVDVWVVPGASSDGVAGIHDGAVRVRVSAPPEGGKANRAVGRVLAAFFGVRRASVIEGVTSRRKRVLVSEIGVAEARRRLSDQGL
jgi:uncharacterized protein (TIGR00251 family)